MKREPVLPRHRGLLARPGPARAGEPDAVPEDRARAAGDLAGVGGATASPGRRAGDRVDPAGARAVRALLAPGCCLLDVDSDHRETLLARMVDSLRAQSAVHDSTMVLSLLLEREKLGPTAIGKGVAIPHARSLGVSDLRVALATSRRGIPWGAPDGEPVHLVFLVLAPGAERARKPYLELIASIAERTRLAVDRRRLLEATTFDEMASAMEDQR